MALTLAEIEARAQLLSVRLANAHPGWRAYLELVLRKARRTWAATEPLRLPADKEYDEFTPAQRAALVAGLKNAVADSAAQTQIDELVS